MPVKAKTKASELFKLLNVLFLGEDRDEFTLRKIKKETEALRSSDAFAAYILLGGLASLEHDVEGMRRNHSKAIKIRPDDPDANINYASSLKNLGFYTEARKFAERAYLADQTYLRTLNDLIEMCWASGRVREAMKWLRRWKLEEHGKANDTREATIRATELLDENGVSDDEVERLVQLKLSVLHKEKIYPSRSIGVPMEDEESRWLNYLVEVRLSPKEVVELNFKAADKLAKSDIPTSVTNSVIVTFTSAVS